MISIENVSVKYGEQNILNNLSVQLEQNCIHGIVGLNGAGKTTLLNSIFGLKKIETGKIIYNQEKISKKLICYVMAEEFFYAGITGNEYLNLFGDIVDSNVKYINEIFKLPLNEEICKYSTGMKKKLSLLSMLKQDKPIIILDEPFNGLDIESCRALRSILLRLKTIGKTIIITSHIIESLTGVCDSIHYLANGRISKSVSSCNFDAFLKEIFDKIEDENRMLIEKIN